MWVNASPIDLTWNSTFVPLGWILYQLCLCMLKPVLWRTRLKTDSQRLGFKDRFLTLFGKCYVINEREQRNDTAWVAHECASLSERERKAVAVATQGLCKTDGGHTLLAQQVTDWSCVGWFLSNHSPQTVLSTKAYQEHLPQLISKQMLELFTDEPKVHSKNKLYEWHASSLRNCMSLLKCSWAKYRKLKPTAW